MIDYLEIIGLSLNDISYLFECYNNSFIRSIDLNNFKKIVKLLSNLFSKDDVENFIINNLEIFSYDNTIIEKNLKRNSLDSIIKNPELLYSEV